MVTTDSSRIDAAIFPEIDDLPVISKMPDPLVFRGDTPVASLDEWENLRKPELKALFQHYMYGFAPAPPPIRATVRSVDETVFGGAAIMKQVAITFGPEGTPPIELLLFLPKLEAGTLPPSVFLGLNFGGNHTVLAD